MRLAFLALLLTAFSAIALAEDQGNHYTFTVPQKDQQKVQRFTKGYQHARQDFRVKKDKIVNDFNSLQKTKEGLIVNQ